MSSAKPIHGILVTEIGHSIAAPLAGSIFSELGAEVFKVENPRGGDHLRGWVGVHPQTAALGILPVSFDGTRPAMQWPVPQLGEHNELSNEAP